MLSTPLKQPLTRFGVSMDAPLVEKFDRWLQTAGHPNRSEAFRTLVRKELAQEAWRRGRAAVAVISLVYDHHQPDLLRRLSHLEHEHGELVVSSQHVHLDHHNCLEVLIARGDSLRLEKFADKLRSFKGVRHATVSGIGLEGAVGA